MATNASRQGGQAEIKRVDGCEEVSGRRDDVRQDSIKHRLSRAFSVPTDISKHVDLLSASSFERYNLQEQRSRIVKTLHLSLSSCGSPAKKIRQLSDRAKRLKNRLMSCTYTQTCKARAAAKTKRRTATDSSETNGEDREAEEELAAMGSVSAFDDGEHEARRQTHSESAPEHGARDVSLHSAHQQSESRSTFSSLAAVDGDSEEPPSDEEFCSFSEVFRSLSCDERLWHEELLPKKEESCVLSADWIRPGALARNSLRIKSNPDCYRIFFGEPGDSLLTFDCGAPFEGDCDRDSSNSPLCCLRKDCRDSRGKQRMLRVRSHLEISDGVDGIPSHTYVEDSDWEMCSEAGAPVGGSCLGLISKAPSPTDLALSEQETTSIFSEPFFDCDRSDANNFPVANEAEKKSKENSARALSRQGSEKEEDKTSQTEDALIKYEWKAEVITKSDDEARSWSLSKSLRTTRQDQDEEVVEGASAVDAGDSIEISSGGSLMSSKSGSLRQVSAKDSAPRQVLVDKTNPDELRRQHLGALAAGGKCIAFGLPCDNGGQDKEKVDEHEPSPPPSAKDECSTCTTPALISRCTGQVANKDALKETSAAGAPPTHLHQSLACGRRVGDRDCHCCRDSDGICIALTCRAHNSHQTRPQQLLERQLRSAISAENESSRSLDQVRLRTGSEPFVERFSDTTSQQCCAIKDAKVKSARECCNNDVPTTESEVSSSLPGQPTTETGPIASGQQASIASIFEYANGEKLGRGIDAQNGEEMMVMNKRSCLQREASSSNDSGREPLDTTRRILMATHCLPAQQLQSDYDYGLVRRRGQYASDGDVLASPIEKVRVESESCALIEVPARRAKKKQTSQTNANPRDEPRKPCSDKASDQFVDVIDPRSAARQVVVEATRPPLLVGFLEHQPRLRQKTSPSRTSSSQLSAGHSRDALAPSSVAQLASLDYSPRARGQCRSVILVGAADDYDKCPGVSRPSSCIVVLDSTNSPEQQSGNPISATSNCSAVAAGQATSIVSWYVSSELPEEGVEDEEEQTALKKRSQGDQRSHGNEAGAARRNQECSESLRQAEEGAGRGLSCYQPVADADQGAGLRRDPSPVSTFENTVCSSSPCLREPDKSVKSDASHHQAANDDIGLGTAVNIVTTRQECYTHVISVPLLAHCFPDSAQSTSKVVVSVEGALPSESSADSDSPGACRADELGQRCSQVSSVEVFSGAACHRDAISRMASDKGVAYGNEVPRHGGPEETREEIDSVGGRGVHCRGSSKGDSRAEIYFRNSNDGEHQASSPPVAAESTQCTTPASSANATSTTAAATTAQLFLHSANGLRAKEVSDHEFGSLQARIENERAFDSVEAASNASSSSTIPASPASCLPTNDYATCAASAARGAIADEKAPGALAPGSDAGSASASRADAASESPAIAWTTSPSPSPLQPSTSSSSSSHAPSSCPQSQSQQHDAIGPASPLSPACSSRGAHESSSVSAASSSSSQLRHVDALDGVVMQSLPCHADHDTSSAEVSAEKSPPVPPNAATGPRGSQQTPMPHSSVSSSHINPPASDARLCSRQAQVQTDSYNSMSSLDSTFESNVDDDYDEYERAASGSESSGTSEDGLFSAPDYIDDSECAYGNPLSYSLHTIIEESESERDTSPPPSLTDDAPAKSEVNADSGEFFHVTPSDKDRGTKGRSVTFAESDSDTEYSDVVSDNSESAMETCDEDAVELASSRLEKYFTSGLLPEEVAVTSKRTSRDVVESDDCKAYAKRHLRVEPGSSSAPAALKAFESESCDTMKRKKRVGEKATRVTFADENEVFPVSGSEDACMSDNGEDVCNSDLLSKASALGLCTSLTELNEVDLESAEDAELIAVMNQFLSQVSSVLSSTSGATAQCDSGQNNLEPLKKLESTFAQLEKYLTSGAGPSEVERDASPTFDADSLDEDCEGEPEIASAIASATHKAPGCEKDTSEKENTKVGAQKSEIVLVEKKSQIVAASGDEKGDACQPCEGDASKLEIVDSPSTSTICAERRFEKSLDCGTSAASSPTPLSAKPNDKHESNDSPPSAKKKETNEVGLQVEAPLLQPTGDAELMAFMNKFLAQISTVFAGDRTGVPNSLANGEAIESGPLKALESQIALLMQTVSPAGQSPSNANSSSSSTIGSNNSDYGSDTLESAENSYEEGADKAREGSQPVPVVSEETAFICQQLIGSLKSHGESSAPLDDTKSAVVEEINSEMSKAKNYIQDRIVALMHSVQSSSAQASPTKELLNNKTKRNRKYSAKKDETQCDSSECDSPRLGVSKKPPSESGSETMSASVSIPSYDDSATDGEVSQEMDELFARVNKTRTNGFAGLKVAAGEDDKVSLKSWEARISLFAKVSADVESASVAADTCIGSTSNALELEDQNLESPLTANKNLGITVNGRELQNEACASQILVAHSDIKAPFVTCGANAINKTALQTIATASTHKTIVRVDNSRRTSECNSPIFESLKDRSFSSDSVSSVQTVRARKVGGFNSTVATNSPTEMSSEGTSSGCALDADGYSDGGELASMSIKASSENNLLLAERISENKSTVNKVTSAKSTGNMSGLGNSQTPVTGTSTLPNPHRSAFRDTGYYSYKSSEESIRSLDENKVASTQMHSSASSYGYAKPKTIIEVDEDADAHEASQSVYTMPRNRRFVPGSHATSVAKCYSFSSSSIPDAVINGCASLPSSSRNKVSPFPSGAPQRPRSSIFSTSGVLRKLLRDENFKNSPRKIRHRLRGHQTSNASGGVPQISVSDYSEHSLSGRGSFGSSNDVDSPGKEDDIDRVLAYHSRSQTSLSSFGARSESLSSVYSAAGGGRYGTVTVTGEVLFGLSYNYKAGAMEVHVKECRNLAAVDAKCASYVKVYLLPDRTKCGKRKTKIKKHSLNPIFDETLRFFLTISEIETRNLWISVWHADMFGRNDFLGEVTLPLGHEVFENPGLKWYPLQERIDAPESSQLNYKGDLFVALKFVPIDPTSRGSVGLKTRGELHVMVKEAHNLMPTRSNGTSDPFVKSYFLPDRSKTGKQKTPVCRKSCNPKWNHTFIYDDLNLNELRSRCLELTIWDYDKLTSNDFLGGVRLGLGLGTFEGRIVDWMDSAGDEISLWQQMLDRPNMWVYGELRLRPTMQTRR